MITLTGTAQELAIDLARVQIVLNRFPWPLRWAIWPIRARVWCLKAIALRCAYDFHVARYMEELERRKVRAAAPYLLNGVLKSGAVTVLASGPKGRR
jgi:hypothetical protein